MSALALVKAKVVSGRSFTGKSLWNHRSAWVVRSSQKHRDYCNLATNPKRRVEDSTTLVAMLGGVASLRPVLSMMMMVIPRPERSAQRRAVAPEFREDFANTRCFVENLSKNTDWAALKDHFKAEGYPVIYASVSTDRDGSSKGCGIVQFETVHAAQHAIDFMKGTLLDGQDINIRPDFQEQSRRTAAGPNDDHFESRGGLGRRDRRDDTGASSRSRLGGFSRAAGDTAPVDIPLVESLLSERTELRKRRDFDGADAIREELRRMGIGVDDKARTWVVMGRGGSGAPGGDDANGRKGRAERSEDERDAQPWMSKPWTRVEGTDDGREVDEAEVLLRLAARDDARERRDFVGADSILEELIRMGVGVDDARRQRCWWLGRRADGREQDQIGTGAAPGRRKWYRGDEDGGGAEGSGDGRRKTQRRM